MLRILQVVHAVDDRDALPAPAIRWLANPHCLLVAFLHPIVDYLLVFIWQDIRERREAIDVAVK